MVTGITERNQMKTELVNLGYSLRYIDEWQPKTTLYRHKASYNDEGKITDAIGTSVPNVPGNPDYVLRKSKIGLFRWPPGENCECRWCAETKQVVEKPRTMDEAQKGMAENSNQGATIRLTKQASQGRLQKS
jgi:hypothetical protein